MRLVHALLFKLCGILCIGLGVHTVDVFGGNSLNDNTLLANFVAGVVDVDRHHQESVVQNDGWMRACYLSSGLNISRVDPHLCTHLLVFYGGIGADGMLNVSVESELKLRQIVKLKTANSRLVVSVTIGADNDRFAAVASDQDRRVAFSQSVASFLQKTNVDGIDLDWEFPAYFRPFNERHDFTLLLQSLRQALDNLGRRRILSAAVGAPVDIVDLSYEVSAISVLVDFISIMTYDYHLYSPLTPVTGHNAPLFASQRDKGAFRSLNTNASVHYWIEKGMPKSKILVGLPTYGHGFRLAHANHNDLYAPASGPWKDGYIGLVDVCKMLRSGGVVVWDAYALVPYMYHGSLWFSFDNAASLMAKAAFVRSMDVAGAMTYDLNHDDWQNACGFGVYPLHAVIKAILPTGL